MCLKTPALDKTWYVFVFNYWNYFLKINLHRWYPSYISSFVRLMTRLYLLKVVLFFNFGSNLSSEVQFSLSDFRCLPWVLQSTSGVLASVFMPLQCLFFVPQFLLGNLKSKCIDACSTSSLPNFFVATQHLYDLGIGHTFLWLVQYLQSMSVWQNTSMIGNHFCCVVWSVKHKI